MVVITWHLIDTGETLRVGDPVYLLQPGRSSVFEPEYGGDGTIGGWDVHLWLGWHNAAPEGARISAIDKDQRESYRRIGLAIDINESLYRDRNGDVWTPAPASVPTLTWHQCPIDRFSVVPQLGKRVSELLKSGEWEIVSVTDVLALRAPLRLARRNARYEAFEGGSTPAVAQDNAQRSVHRNARRRAS